MRSDYGAVRRHYGAIRRHYDVIRRHYDVMRCDCGAVQRHYDVIRRHCDAIRRHYGTVRRHYDRIRGDYGAVRGDYGAVRGDCDAGYRRYRSRLRLCGRGPACCTEARRVARHTGFGWLPMPDRRSRLTPKSAAVGWSFPRGRSAAVGRPPIASGNSACCRRPTAPAAGLAAIRSGR